MGRGDRALAMAAAILAGGAGVATGRWFGAAARDAGSAGRTVEPAADPREGPTAEVAALRIALEEMRASRDAAARETERLSALLRDAWAHSGAPPSEAAVGGEWLHCVDFGEERTIELRAGGVLLAGERRESWTLSGNTLTFRWSDGDAPGGVWTDTCFVSAAADLYIGRNQNGNVISGRRPESSARR